ncbi:MAG: RNA polymerase subunit sigma-70, partial [Solirubrobacteraceae bacterium]|nr:RNA polymerase subunit sigma-70 [Solirubrobacteraceae bacterium]
DERQVLDLRFGTGREGEHSVEQTARKLGVPVKVARELERRALERLSREPDVAALREVAA